LLAIPRPMGYHAPPKSVLRAPYLTLNR
jgi:hypothetical protein